MYLHVPCLAQAAAPAVVHFEPGNITCHVRKVQQGSVCGVLCGGWESSPARLFAFLPSTPGLLRVCAPAGGGREGGSDSCKQSSGPEIDLGTTVTCDSGGPRPSPVWSTIWRRPGRPCCSARLAPSDASSSWILRTRILHSRMLPRSHLGCCRVAEAAEMWARPVSGRGRTQAAIQRPPDPKPACLRSRTGMQA